MVQSVMNDLTETPNEDALPEEVKAIFTKGAKKRRRLFRDSFIIGFFVVCAVLSRLLYPLFFHQPPPRYFLFVALHVVVYPSLVYLWWKNKKGVYTLDKQDAEYLASLRDRRVLGIFLDYLRTSSYRKFLSQDKKLLLALLSPITSADSLLLTKYQKKMLVEILQTTDGETRLAILKTLQEIGDADQLSSLRVWKFNQLGLVLSSDLKAAYKSCVSAIEARAAASRSDSQLLRPSSPNDGADTYLRPVTHKPDEDADTLLRAETGEKDKEAS